MTKIKSKIKPKVMLNVRITPEMKTKYKKCLLEENITIQKHLKSAIELFIYQHEKMLENYKNEKHGN